MLCSNSKREKNKGSNSTNIVRRNEDRNDENNDYQRSKKDLQKALFCIIFHVGGALDSQFVLSWPLGAQHIT